MDRDQVFQSARQWYPVAAAILSSILNFVSFMIGVGWSSSALFGIGFIALLGTTALSAMVIWILYRLSVSGRVEEFTVLSSEDEYCLRDPKEAKYTRKMKIRVNKSAQHFVTYPPEVDGKLSDFRSYPFGDEKTEYTVSAQKLGGRRILFIYLGRPLKKGEIIEGLCLECKLVNSFESEQEGVSVGTDPGQEHCSVRVVLSKDTPPTPPKSDWFVLYGRNPIPLRNGSVQAYQLKDGDHVIDCDFSPNLSPGVALRCAISWRWKLAIL